MAEKESIPKKRVQAKHMLCDSKNLLNRKKHLKITSVEIKELPIVGFYKLKNMNTSHLQTKLNKSGVAKSIEMNEEYNNKSSSIDLIVIGTEQCLPRSFPGNVPVISQSMFCQMVCEHKHTEKLKLSLLDEISRQNDIKISQKTSQSDVINHQFESQSSVLIDSLTMPAESQDSDPFMENATYIPRVRQTEGVLDPDAGILNNNVSQWNRDLARFPARMFALRWNEGKVESAFKYLEQSQKILKCQGDITSSAVAKRYYPTGVFGDQGLLLIDRALDGMNSPPHDKDSDDNERESKEGLFLWAILWKEVRAIAY